MDRRWQTRARALSHPSHMFKTQVALCNGFSEDMHKTRDEGGIISRLC